jgi:hypothetical protein
MSIRRETEVIMRRKATFEVLVPTPQCRVLIHYQGSELDCASFTGREKC